MNARIASRSAIIVALVLLSSCFPDYFPRRKLKVNLSPTDVAGEWHLNKESARMLEHYRVAVSPADSFIEFFADGRCELHKFVEEEEAITGPATWKIGNDAIDRKVSVMHITYRTAERQFTSSLNFTRRQGKIIMWQYHSDPDGREYTEYQRN